MTKRRSQFAIGVRGSRAGRAPRANPGGELMVKGDGYGQYHVTHVSRPTQPITHRGLIQTYTSEAQAKRKLKEIEKALGVTKRNPWPFSSKKAAAPARLKSSLTIAQAVRDAKAAGYAGTNFNDWLERKRLADRSSSQLATLGDAYRSGMDQREADRDKKERDRSEARRAREDAAERKRQDREEERAEKAHKQEKAERKARALESFKPDDEKLDRHFRKGGTLAQFLAGEIRNPGSLADVQARIGKLVDDIRLKGDTRAKAERLRKLKEERDRLEDIEPQDYSLYKGNRARRRNPGTSADAQAAYEEFHGKPSNESVRITRRVHFHKNLASAGQLRSLILKSVGGKKIRIRFTKDTLLTFNTAKNQLFITGGDQSIDDLKPYGIRSPHEIETLGKVISLDYFTTKDHLGDEGGTAVYRHKLRTTNQNGQHVTVRVARYPDLIYYTRDRRMEFSGGSYEIIAEGIDK